MKKNPSNVTDAPKPLTDINLIGKSCGRQVEKPEQEQNHTLCHFLRLLCSQLLERVRLSRVICSGWKPGAMEIRWKDDRRSQCTN